MHWQQIFYSNNECLRFQELYTCVREHFINFALVIEMNFITKPMSIPNSQVTALLYVCAHLYLELMY